MAVTHADLEPSGGRTHVRSKSGVLLMVFTIFLGISCFVLCLMAESWRSQVLWVTQGDNKVKGEKSECVYSSNGKSALLCAGGALVSLAIAMILKHAYILVAVSNKSSPDLQYSASAKSLTSQAAFFFFTTWICFGIGEILLLAGVSVESGHLTKWLTARASCFAVRQGVFAAAGVFGLATVSFATGLYLTALNMPLISQQHHIHQQERRTDLTMNTTVVAEGPTHSHTHHLHLSKQISHSLYTTDSLV